MKYLFSLIIVFNCFFQLSAQQKNPLLDVIGKPYPEYYEVFGSLLDDFFYVDSLSRVEMLSFYEEAAAVDKSGAMELEYRIVEGHVRFYESRGGGFVASSEYTAEEQAEYLYAMAMSAKKQNHRYIQVRALYDAAETYRIFAQNYERAFAIYLEAFSVLETIPDKKFDIRFFVYYELAALYYRFREYDDAIFWYQKMLNEIDVTNPPPHNNHYSAMNELGMCYRLAYKDYDRSDSCFVKILEWISSEKNEYWRNVWEGVAEGNLGQNYFLRGQFDIALKWLIPSIDKMTRFSDFPFASQRAVNVADIYLQEKDIASAKKYVDIALDRHNRSKNPEKSSELYDILTKYYTYTGDRQKAIAYHDSTLLAKSRENEAFSGLVLRRVEQQLRTVDAKIHEQKLEAEQVKSRRYKWTAGFVSGVSVIILTLLGLTLFFYRRKRSAYQSLVVKSQQWANEQIKTKPKQENIPPEKEAVSLLKEVYRLLEDEKIYKDNALNLQNLAEMLHTNRTYLSKAINSITGSNFSSFINEYRIKEAIKILSNPKFDHLSIDYLAEEVGFANRFTFSNAFKKVVGMTPSEFKKNRKN